MRRSLILGSSVAITVVTLMLAIPPSAAPVVICPVAAGSSSGVVNCCGPPVMRAFKRLIAPPVDCCPGNALCATKLSIGAAPNPSVEPESVVISGRVPSAAAVTTTSVDLWQQLPGQSQFQKLLSQPTDGSGHYTITQAPATNRQWYVTAGSLRSVTIQQQVQAVVTLAASGHRGGKVTFSGLVSPSHANQRVMLEVRSGRGWAVIARPRLDEHSCLHLGFLALFGKDLVFQAVLPGDSRNVRSSSAIVSIPRR